MDKNKLIAGLDQMIGQDFPDEEKMFLRFIKEVWQIDYTISPLVILDNLAASNLSFFSQFLASDEGDEYSESQLINYTMTKGSEPFLALKFNLARVSSLIEQLNSLREAANS